MVALLLDLANIVGGALLAVGLLARLPSVGSGVERAVDKLAPFAWIVGIVALVAGGYYLIEHLVSGPHVFHFEIVGILVGVALLWDRLRGHSSTEPRHGATDAPVATKSRGQLEGATLLLAVFGVIAILVGIQGLFTPN